MVGQAEPGHNVGDILVFPAEQDRLILELAGLAALLHICQQLLQECIIIA